MWSFAFEYDKNALKSCKSSPRAAFVCDRQKGQEPTIKAWYPEVCHDDCTFHLKDNMREQQNGKANKIELLHFDRYIYSANITEAIQRLDRLLKNVRPNVKEYLQNSILTNNSCPQRYVDALVIAETKDDNGLSMDHRENVRAATHSEQFNNAVPE